MSINMGAQKQKTTETAKRDPWAPTIEPVKAFISNIPTGADAGPTDKQTQAFGQLEQLASQGDPNAAAYQKLATDQLGYQSSAPMIKTGLDDYTRRMSSVADGKNQDLANDPYLQQLLTQVGDEAANRNRAAFAAAGRDGSGYDMQTTARGVTQAQLPILMDQLNKEKARTDAAAAALHGATTSDAGAIDTLTSNALATRKGGLETGKAALEAKAFGPTQLLNLEEQMKGMKMDDLAKIAELLYPAAQLGSQQEGTKKSKGTSVGASLKLI